MKGKGAPPVTFDITRHPSAGPHPVWYVLLDGQLLCACAYRKGALALIAFLRDSLPHSQR